MPGNSLYNSPGVLLPLAILHCLDICPQCILSSTQPPLSAMLRMLVDPCMSCEGDVALQVLGKKGQDLESFYMYPSIITVTILTLLGAYMMHTRPYLTCHDRPETLHCACPTRTRP